VADFQSVQFCLTRLDKSLTNLRITDPWPTAPPSQWVNRRQTCLATTIGTELITCSLHVPVLGNQEKVRMEMSPCRCRISISAERPLMQLGAGIRVLNC
jgi:hypothetical protein